MVVSVAIMMVAMSKNRYCVLPCSLYQASGRPPCTSSVLHPGCGTLMMVMMQMVAAMTFLELDLETVVMHWVAAMVLDSGHWTLELSCAHYHP